MEVCRLFMFVGVICLAPGLHMLYPIQAFSNIRPSSISGRTSRGLKQEQLQRKHTKLMEDRHHPLLLHSSLKSATGNTTRAPLDRSSEASMINDDNDDGIDTMQTLESPNRALEHFLSISESFQRKHEKERTNTDRDGATPKPSIQIISRGSKVPPSLEKSIVSIKSLVFLSGTDDNCKIPFLVVLPEEDRVDLAKLNRIMQSSELAPSDQVEELCGFVPKQVPPLGHSTPTSNAPLPTYVAQALVDRMVGTTEPPILLGGGGHPYWSSLVSLEALLELDYVHPADVTVDKFVVNGDSSRSVGGDEEIQQIAIPTTATSPSNAVELQPKPFFPVAPPPLHIAQLVLEQRELSSPLTPTMVTVVGRVGGVRQMAKRLVFCDLLPPTMTKKNERDKKAYSKNDLVDERWPWRYSNIDGTTSDMSVQLIAGKTLCRTLGNEQGEVAIKALKEGQLILVEAKTNVGNRESLTNWVSKRNFDLVVVEYQILEGARQDAGNFDSGTPVYKHKQQPSSSQTNNPSTLQFSLPRLTMKDLFTNMTSTTDAVKEKLSEPIIVDDMTSIQAFAKDYMGLVEVLTAASTEVSTESELELEQQYRGQPTNGLVGIDCEWRPQTFMEFAHEPQPVLLLQISLHPLKRVYIFDLMTLLRPMQPPDEPMNGLEDALSDILGDFFSSECLLKAGYQLPSDLRQLAASYPHIPCFQQVNSVLEISTLVKRALHITKQKQSRSITMSLARLTSHYLGRYLEKGEQVSDWSVRPLVSSQVEYAALDAAVSPVLVERTLQSVNATIMGSSTPSIERWDGDTSFDKSIRSLRFVFLPPESENMIRKLRAKQIVGSTWVVTQDWRVGEKPPSELSVDGDYEDGPYMDATGILRVPSRTISLLGSASKNGQWERLVGQRAGRSKDKCLDLLLEGQTSLEKGSKLEYPQRSGYVEFEDGVALFVNNPDKSGLGRPRSYPNEWVQDGRYLTWFLRSRDWLNGKTDLARKLISSPESSIVALFVRMTNGQFLSCGRCRISLPDDTNIHKDDTGSSSSLDKHTEWGLVQLNLELVDHEALSSIDDFKELIGGVSAAEG